MVFGGRLMLVAGRVVNHSALVHRKRCPHISRGAYRLGFQTFSALVTKSLHFLILF